MSTLQLTNPHAVLAALESRPQDVLAVRLPEQGAGPAWQTVADRAQAAGIRLRRTRGEGDGGRPRDAGRRGAGRRGGGPAKTGREGGASAEVRERPPVTLDELFAGAKQREDGRGLWLAVDQVQDPRNLGAIFRSASFFGVAGVLLTRDQSAPLTAVSYDTASGGLESVPYAWAANLARDLGEARDAGLWILGAAGEADTDVGAVPRDRPWLLVVGNEEKGLRRLTRESCDQLCRLTPRGAVDSLNVSVASAVLMAELRRPL